VTRLFLLANMRNEAHRLDWFLDHYRAIGVTDFIVVDNGSTDDTVARLLAAPDTMVVEKPQESFRAARHGVDWLNALRAEHALGHWCLFVDADEMLVYPGWPDLPLTAITHRMEARGHRCLIAPMIDMFDARDPFGRTRSPGQPPLEAWPHHLSRDLRVLPVDRFPYVGFRGGARERFFGAALKSHTGAPSTNLRKIPLVWAETGAEYVSVHSTVELAPTDITGALLHFKINGELAERAPEEAARKEHAEGGVEYRAYAEALAGRPAAARVDHDSWEGVAGLIAQGRIACPPDWHDYLTRKGAKLAFPPDPPQGPLSLWPALAHAIRAGLGF
jgi:hypothetical protein